MCPSHSPCMQYETTMDWIRVMGPGSWRAVAVVPSRTAHDLYARSCMDNRPVVIGIGVGVFSLDK